MATGLQNRHPLPRSGLRQRDRAIPALDPATLELEDRGPQARLEFAQQLSALVRFQQLSDATPADANGDWQPFFSDFNFPEYAIKSREFADDYRTFSDSPHGGLYAIYQKLFEHLREGLNRLPKAHLDFYYREVLRLDPRAAKTDRVHVVFAPAKNRRVVRVPEKTALNAGKAVTYETANEVFVSQAEIAATYSILSDPLLTDRPRVAFDAKSLDGLGEPLTPDQPTWKPFGSAGMPALETGFAIAAPVLALKEGERTITVTVTLQADTDAPELPSDDDLRDSLVAEFSGEEEWLGPYPLESAVASSVGDRTVKIVLSVRLGAEEDPVSYYNISKLEGGFHTVSPVLKLLSGQTTDTRARRLLSQSTVGAIKIDVAVNSAKEFDLENDLGRLNPDKPFMPFGPQPTKGSSFYLSSEELLSKEVTDFKLRINWQDAPAKLADHYGAYLQDKIHRRPPGLKLQNTRSTAGRLVRNNSHFQASMAFVKRGQDDRSVTVSLFDSVDATQQAILSSTQTVRPFLIHSYSVLAGYFSKATKNVKALFPGAIRLVSSAASPAARRHRGNGLSAKVDLEVRLPNLQARGFRIRKRKFGVIRVTLKQHFFHRVYPYYLAATIADSGSEVSPQEPYTPIVESMELDYKATAHYGEFAQDTASAYQDKTVQLFHLTPFGHAEQHAFLTAELPFVSDRSIRLTPEFAPAGELIIGLKNVEEGGSLSMLVQVAPGTANPLRQREQVEWSLLVRNHWRPFEKDELLLDETNQLLTSGIVRLKIPTEPINDNTLYSPDMVWIRASVAGHADAVCDLRAVHLHAVAADVRNTDSDDGSGSIAAETIARFRTPVASIKSVGQPYASFGGRAAESDSAFYRRISERLRHKQRAVTAGDYERLVLEEFPQIHKVRCLTHTDAESCASPGNVSLIVIPRTAPEERFDRLRPRADLNTLSRIDDFANSANTYHVTAHARNPDYEEVQLAFSVRFHADRPFLPYRTTLNEDLIRFLSPWASDSEAMPAFGLSLHKSQIIKFIEGREYVDFITDVRLYHGAESTADLASVQPSSSSAILISSVQHDIDEAERRP